jgi:hypothetical protein
VERLLTLNAWQEDWPLQVGQKLVIDPGHVTPSPTLSNIQKLTPEADGNYYHTVSSGETLSWIAGWYDVPLADLMSWNLLNNASVIRPGQKLLLLVTPPATETATPSPSPVTTPSPVPSFTPLPTATPPVSEAEPQPRSGMGLAFVLLAAVAGGVLWWRFGRKS